MARESRKMIEANSSQDAPQLLTKFDTLPELLEHLHNQDSGLEPISSEYQESSVIRSKSKVKKTASYSKTNANFVLQNLPPQTESSLPQAVLAVVHNILVRGNPTLPSKNLQRAFGLKSDAKSIQRFTPLISPRSPCWKRTIRGDDRCQDYPAQVFHEELWDKYLPEWQFCRQLIIPEVPINEITQVPYKAYENSQVDFYLPQAFLVIEIDGAQHLTTRKEDEARDSYLSKYGIKTIRIPVSSIRDQNALLEQKFSIVAKRLERILKRQEETADTVPDQLKLSAYRKAFINPLPASDPILRINASMRMQLLLLELLARGGLRADSKETIGLYAPDCDDFENQSVQDLSLWLSHVCQLQKVSFKSLSFSFHRYKDERTLKAGPERFKINLKMLSRYTDSFQNNSGTIYCRTDYLDVFLWYKKGSSQNLKKTRFLEYDHAALKTAEPVCYQVSLSEAGDSRDEKSLIYLAENIFMQNVESFEFNTGQLPIIENALRREHTIGLLPTGGGKSLCYQIASILQPGITFVVCPIKSLMTDQVDELNRVAITRCAEISGGLDAEEKEKALSQFSKGRILFLYISPERFQIPSFRDSLLAIQKNTSIAHAVIDEVHCLSEWGHDFRTSYLNLARTIRSFCGSDFRFIALTATASINVLKNVQIELGVKDENVRTLRDYTRPELTFKVVGAKGDKFKSLDSLLSKINTSPLEDGTKRCGLIFTSNVSGGHGCYRLSSRLSIKLNKEVKYFSADSPKDSGRPIYTSDIYSEYKAETQRLFKEDQVDLLVATKAFGMGVNKKNIFYTIHFGIPQSMEALYQEGGRAGRDKSLFKKYQAESYVLFSEESSSSIADALFEKTTTKDDSEKLFDKLDRFGDLNAQFYFLNKGLIDVEGETKKLVALITFLHSYKGEKVELCPEKQNISRKDYLEKLIYRLRLLGIIEDWTVSDFFRERYEVKVSNFDNELVLSALIKAIKPYDPEFEFVGPDVASIKFLEFAIRTLLEWTHNNFIYNRKKSLQNVYENCRSVIRGDQTEEEFKRFLEDYFKFSGKTHILQHIAEKPQDHEAWFEVLSPPNDISSKEHYSELRNTLTRFLESYEASTGLDFISGVTSLALNNFSHSDGKTRLLSALAKIRQNARFATEDILDRLLSVAEKLDDAARDALASTLLPSFESDPKLTDLIIQRLDSYATQELRMNLDLSKLKSINTKLDDSICRLKPYS